MDNKVIAFLEQADKALSVLSEIKTNDPAINKVIQEAIESIEEKTTAVDLGMKGYSWKDGSLKSGAVPDKVLNQAALVLKQQAPDVYQAIIKDSDDALQLPGSDLQMSADGQSIIVSVNGKPVGNIVGGKFNRTGAM